MSIIGNLVAMTKTSPFNNIGCSYNLCLISNVYLMKGNCYVWSLTGGTNDDPTVLHPRTKIPRAHTRAALKCLFSPDSW